MLILYSSSTVENVIPYLSSFYSTESSSRFGSDSFNTVIFEEDYSLTRYYTAYYNSEYKATKTHSANSRKTYSYSNTSSVSSFYKEINTAEFSGKTIARSELITYFHTGDQTFFSSESCRFITYFYSETWQRASSDPGPSATHSYSVTSWPGNYFTTYPNIPPETSSTNTIETVTVTDFYTTLSTREIILYSTKSIPHNILVPTGTVAGSNSFTFNNYLISSGIGYEISYTSSTFLIGEMSTKTITIENSKNIIYNCILIAEPGEILYVPKAGLNSVFGPIEDVANSATSTILFLTFLTHSFTYELTAPPSSQAFSVGASTYFIESFNASTIVDGYSTTLTSLEFINYCECLPNEIILNPYIITLYNQTVFTQTITAENGNTSYTIIGNITSSTNDYFTYYYFGNNSYYSSTKNKTIECTSTITKFEHLTPSFYSSYVFSTVTDITQNCSTKYITINQFIYENLYLFSPKTASLLEFKTAQQNAYIPPAELENFNFNKQKYACLQINPNCDISECLAAVPQYIGDHYTNYAPFINCACEDLLLSHSLNNITISRETTSTFSTTFSGTAISSSGALTFYITYTSTSAFSTTYNNTSTYQIVGHYNVGTFNIKAYKHFINQFFTDTFYTSDIFYSNASKFYLGPGVYLVEKNHSTYYTTLKIDAPSNVDYSYMRVYGTNLYSISKTPKVINLLPTYYRSPNEVVPILTQQNSNYFYLSYIR